MQLSREHTKATADGDRAADAHGIDTACGREVHVGVMTLGDARWSARRVSLDVGECPGCLDSTRATLTPVEARWLGTALIAQAAAAERRGGPAPMPAGHVEVTHLAGDSYSIATRGHTVLVDQPADAGGADTAATPTELFVASLASCVAFYAGRFLVRHGLERSGLAVSAEFTMASDRPARVGNVRLRLTVPGGVPPERRGALAAVASHCTVHNTLQHQPSVAIELA
jgi:uncharacterized OsmC-like protein